MTTATFWMLLTFNVGQAAVPMIQPVVFTTLEACETVRDQIIITYGRNPAICLAMPANSHFIR